MSKTRLQDDDPKDKQQAPKRTLSFPALSLHRLAQFDASEEDAASTSATPGLLETGEELRRTLSFKTLKEADAAWVRNKIWRDNKRRNPGRPQDLDQLIAWAVSASFREL